MHNKCTTCAKGYHFYGWKCVSDRQVHFTIKLGIGMDSFIGRFEEVKPYIEGLILDYIDGGE